LRGDAAGPDAGDPKAGGRTLRQPHRPRTKAYATDRPRQACVAGARKHDPAADDAQLRAKNFRSREIAPLRIGLMPCVSANLIVRPLAETARLMPDLWVDVAIFSSWPLAGSEPCWSPTNLREGSPLRRDVHCWRSLAANIRRPWMRSSRAHGFSTGQTKSSDPSLQRPRDR
jgi:hypothetical protein